MQGVRANQLVGYGLVVGLNGTGDSLRNSPFTEQSLQSMLDQMGVNVRQANPRTKNIAAVLVTADLPPFAGRGSRIDVTVSSLGDATSLAGGSLVHDAAHRAPTGRSMRSAQGPVAVSGFQAEGKAESLSQNVPTTGRIAERRAGRARGRRPARRRGDAGARAAQSRFRHGGADRRHDQRLHAQERYGRNDGARAAICGRVALDAAARTSARRASSPRSASSSTEADGPARVVIDERTGTVVIGRDVQISTVAVSHGSLTVRVTESAQVSQPQPFSEGETVVSPETFVTVNQEGANLAIMDGTNLETLVRGLNMMGLKPTGIIAILQAIKTSGALQAELVVQ